jgi:hypothetical protein
MLQYPTWILFLFLVLSGALFAVLVTLIYRKYSKIKILRSHNEVTGFLFLSIASFYALLLSFVVLVVWDQLNEVHSNVSKEGSSAMGLYRDIKYYPDSVASKKLMNIYLTFVYDVIDDEFPQMTLMQQSRRTSESFNQVFYAMERLQPQSQMNIILGALITIFCAVLLDIEHIKMHLVLSSLLGAFIGIFLYTIIFLDHPYTGSQSIKPKLYEKIFTLEQWSSEHETNQKKLTNENK